MIYNVINRGVGRQTLFHKDEDYAAFERVMAEAYQRAPTRIGLTAAMARVRQLLSTHGPAVDMGMY